MGKNLTDKHFDEEYKIICACGKTLEKKETTDKGYDYFECICGRKFYVEEV